MSWLPLGSTGFTPLTVNEDAAAAEADDAELAGSELAAAELAGADVTGVTGAELAGAVVAGRAVGGACDPPTQPETIVTRHAVEAAAGRRCLRVRIGIRSVRRIA
jgi:hypothetical protein